MDEWQKVICRMNRNRLRATKRVAQQAIFFSLHAHIYNHIVPHHRHVFVFQNVTVVHVHSHYGEVDYGVTTNGRIISFSSCSRMWQ